MLNRVIFRAIGWMRFVITLPHKERGEDYLMVAIIAGKNMLIDGVNLVRHLSMSTMMADSLKVKKFVTAPSIKARYNAQVPIVIYAPEGYEVQYRVWEVSNQTYQAIK